MSNELAKYSALNLCWNELVINSQNDRHHISRFIDV